MTHATPGSPLFSLEFFPPRTPEGADKLRAARRQLAQLKPAFCSVTFGAGGSTREGTLSTVLEIRGEGLRGAPHISCIGSSREGLRAVLDEYRRTTSAISSPCAATCRRAPSRRASSATPTSWSRSSARKPATGSTSTSPPIRNVTRRRAARSRTSRTSRARSTPAPTPPSRSTSSIADAYWSFLDACADRGIDVPIVPGIMPIASFSKLARFSDACGAEIPRWIRRKLEGFGDDTASIRAFGLDVVTQLCASLLERGAPGLHFYTLNQAGLTTTIWQRLGI